MTLSRVSTITFNNNMLAGFVEFNTFSMLACYPAEMENMLSQLNVRAESEQIRQFPHCFHDNGQPQTTEVRSISGKRGDPWRSLICVEIR